MFGWLVGFGWLFVLVLLLFGFGFVVLFVLFCFVCYELLVQCSEFSSGSKFALYKNYLLLLISLCLRVRALHARANHELQSVTQKANKQIATCSSFHRILPSPTTDIHSFRPADASYFRSKRNTDDVQPSISRRQPPPNTACKSLFLAPCTPNFEQWFTTSFFQTRP